MTRFLTNRSLIGALLIALAALPPALADDIVLGLTKGDVRILSAGRATPIDAAQGHALRSGDRVYTGRDGWTVLLVPDGSRVVLTANSEFAVRSHDSRRRTGTFALIGGMLRAMISPAPKSPPHYRFNSMTAVAGVRGTDFSMLHRGQANVFFGNNGTVDIQGLNTASKPLTAATVVQTTRGMVPTQPIAIEPGSQLSQARALLNAVTDQAPESWIEAGNLPEIVARWNIAYSRYLADAGRHDEALHVLQVALDLSDAIDIQADARLERGAVLSRDAARADAALEEYAVLLAPGFAGPQREMALYMAGLAHHQQQRASQARTLLLQYLRDYPDGRYNERVKALLGVLGDPQ